MYRITVIAKSKIILTTRIKKTDLKKAATERKYKNSGFGRELGILLAIGVSISALYFAWSLISATFLKVAAPGTGAYAPLTKEEFVAYDEDTIARSSEEMGKKITDMVVSLDLDTAEIVTQNQIDACKPQDEYRGVAATVARRKVCIRREVIVLSSSSQIPDFYNRLRESFVKNEWAGSRQGFSSRADTCYRGSFAKGGLKGVVAVKDISRSINTEVCGSTLEQSLDIAAGVLEYGALFRNTNYDSAITIIEKAKAKDAPNIAVISIEGEYYDKEYWRNAN